MLKNIILSVLFLGAAQVVFAQNLKAPLNWYNLDYENDGVRGMSVEKAYEAFLKNRKSNKVVVAVIDSGIDIEHEDLQSVIWINEDEIPNNGKDDDNNGFVDDVNGWDFAGGADGTDVKQEQLESARLLMKYDKMFGENPKARKIKKYKEEYNLYKKLKKEVAEKKEEASKMLNMYETIRENFVATEEVLKNALGDKELTIENVENLDEKDLEKNVRRAKQYWLQLSNMGADLAGIDEGINHFKGQVNYNYNAHYDARSVVGDKPHKLQYAKYGNNEVEGPDARHGTHVAGIIGAIRNNDKGGMGVADNVSIMVVRAVPDGDERDKDVANAIRYAVDNGAQVINMSFGKPYSPEKEWVDDAVAYAESKDVLIVAAAGNDASDVDEHIHYPIAKLDNGRTVNNWIAVGALSYEDGADMVADFSNYGNQSVNIFAPGVAIYSSVPNNKYEELQGTSMASPAVAGVACLLRSYFPTLTAQQTRQIILDSGVDLKDTKVRIPGGDKKIPFGDLSTSGAVINAYNAVKLAIERTSGQ